MTHKIGRKNVSTVRLLASYRVLVDGLALPVPVHVAAKSLRLGEPEGAKPAFVQLGSIILPSTALLLLLHPCTHIHWYNNIKIGPWKQYAALQYKVQ